MKKISLLAMAAAIAVSAHAQYTCNPSTSEVAAKGVKTVDYITLSDAAVADLEKAGATVNYVGPDANAGRNLWYWENTFVPYDESYPRVDMEEGGYISVQVANNTTWSGAGVNVDVPGLNLSHFNDDTHFHMAYMTPSGNGPAGIAVILFNKTEKGSMPAKMSIGASFEDEGQLLPVVAPALSDDWQGIDITLGQLKKLYPAFDLKNKEAWEGNLFSFLGGGVAGQTMAFDAIYFYNLKDGAAVEGIEEDAAGIIFSGKTINALAGKGIQLYNLAGQLVKSTESAVLGVEGLEGGIYVAKSGNVVKKIVVR